MYCASVVDTMVVFAKAIPHLCDRKTTDSDAPQAEMASLCHRIWRREGTRTETCGLYANKMAPRCKI